MVPLMTKVNMAGTLSCKETQAWLVVQLSWLIAEFSPNSVWFKEIPRPSTWRSHLDSMVCTSKTCWRSSLRTCSSSMCRKKRHARSQNSRIRLRMSLKRDGCAWSIYFSISNGRITRVTSSWSSTLLDFCKMPTIWSKEAEVNQRCSCSSNNPVKPPSRPWSKLRTRIRPNWRAMGSNSCCRTSRLKSTTFSWTTSGSREKWGIPRLIQMAVGPLASSKYSNLSSTWHWQSRARGTNCSQVPRTLSSRLSKSFTNLGCWRRNIRMMLSLASALTSWCNPSYTRTGRELGKSLKSQFCKHHRQTWSLNLTSRSTPTLTASYIEQFWSFSCVLTTFCQISM